MNAAEITPEQIEACRLRIEAEHASGRPDAVEGETALAIIAVCQRLMGDVLSLGAKLDAATKAEQKGGQTPIHYTATGFGATTTEETGQVILNIDTADGRVDIDLGTEFAEPMGLLLLDDPEHSDGGTFDDEEVADHV